MKPDAQDMPVGLTMALAQNLDAMQTFAALTEKERLEVIERAKSAQSRDEMERLVHSVGEGRLK